MKQEYLIALIFISLWMSFKPYLLDKPIKANEEVVIMNDTVVYGKNIATESNHNFNEVDLSKPNPKTVMYAESFPLFPDTNFKETNL